MFNDFSWKIKGTKQFRGLLLLYCMFEFTFVPLCVSGAFAVVLVY
jgi:hypothetical protein